MDNGYGGAGKIRLLRWGRAEFDSWKHDDWHQHNFYQIDLVCRGECDLYLKAAPTRVHAGEIVFIAPNVLHYYKYDSPFICYSFKFLGNLSDLPIFLRIPAGRETRGVIKSVDSLVRNCLPKELLHLETGADISAADRYAPLIEHLLAGLFESFFVECSYVAQHSAVGTVRALLRENNGMPLSVAEAARKAGYSRCYFSTRIRREVNMSAKAFIDRERSLFAQHYLEHTDMTVGEIAERMGFSNPFHFSNFFRRHEGVSPSRWRRDHLK